MSAKAFDPDCVFCRIARKEIPSAIVFEDEDLVAFRDIAPKAPAHLLVVPRKHIATLSDAVSEDAPLLGKVLTTLGRIAREAGYPEYRAVLNSGAGAGQSVFHVHFHLLAGRPFSWPPG